MNGTTDGVSAGEVLTEVAGKLCYKSFHEDLNPNLKKVRNNNNKKYIENILKQKYYSVLEHTYDTYALIDVSRVVTHEMVCHRIANYSQESLRFVRLTDLKAYFPKAFEAFNLGDSMRKVFESLEEVQKDLAALLDLDNLSFSDKKNLTSAMRRMAPLGLATSIIMTSNVRNWRHVIELRSSSHAEEEIRLVAESIYKDQSARHPNLYQDAKENVVDDVLEITFKSE